jgi:hypothetical protein
LLKPDRRWRADGDHAMKTDITKATAEAAEGTLLLGDDWFDPLEAGVRTRIRGFIEELLEAFPQPWSRPQIAAYL